MGSMRKAMTTITEAIKMFRSNQDAWRWIKKGSLFAMGTLAIAALALLVGTERGPWRPMVWTASAVASEESPSSGTDQDGWEAELKSGPEAEGHSHESGDHAHGEEVHEPGEVEVPQDMREPLGIATEPVQKGDLAVTLELYGWVRPREGDIVQLRAPIAGIVKTIHIRAGDWVAEGSPLVSIRVPSALEWQKTILSSLNERHRLEASQGLLRSEGQAKVVQLLGELRVAAAEKARLAEEVALIEQAGSGAVPKRDINTKRGELKSAAAVLEAKRALALAYDLEPSLVAQIESGTGPMQAPEGTVPPDIRREIEDARFKIRNLANDSEVACQNLKALGFDHDIVMEKLEAGEAGAISDVLTLRAETPGLVVEVFARRQSALKEADELARIIDYRKVYIDAEVPEVDITRVLHRVSDEIPLRVSGLEDRSMIGRVAFFDTSVHPDVRKAHLVLEVENLEGMPLRDHMAASVGIPLAIKQNALSVPKKSIVTDGFEKIVFLDEGEHFHRAVVKTGIETLDRIEVLGGASPEDKVVVSGARALYLALSIPKGGADAHAGHAH
jgi:multidrug efflux pump subunit AcrA (membrane-fusion protein)